MHLLTWNAHSYTVLILFRFENHVKKVLIDHLFLSYDIEFIRYPPITNIWSILDILQSRRLVHRLFFVSPSPIYNVGRSRQPCSVLPTLVLGLTDSEKYEKYIIFLEVFKNLSLFLKSLWIFFPWLYTQFCRISDGGGVGHPPQIIFEGLNWPQQTIYLWKESLRETQIHFRYRKNMLISRLYEQFSRNAPQVLPNGCPKKCQSVKVLKYEHIILWFF